MKLVWVLGILCIIALTIDQGQSFWVGRRRRWLQNVGHFYKKHKKVIIGAVKVAGASLLGKKDSIATLATLKANDQEAYDEVIQQVRESLEDEYPREDVREMMEGLDKLTDMHPDEIQMRNEDMEMLDSEDNKLALDLFNKIEALRKN